MKKFTIVDSQTQRVIVLETEATTFGQLKSELSAKGIDLTNKSIEEGLTHTEFTRDEAILPHDVPYNGTTTNNLVFRITKADKHIASGATRMEAYDLIHKLGLEELVKTLTGRNFTQCPTEVLIAIANENAEPCCEDKDTCPTCGTSSAEIEAIKYAVMSLTQLLYDYDIIDGGDLRTIKDCLVSAEKNDSPYSKEELDKMFE